MAGMSSLNSDFADNNYYVNFVIYCFIGLVFGGVTGWVTSRYLPGLPYTVCIFVEGAILNYAVRLSGNGILTATESFANSSLISDALLYLFLPILIFGETMNLNWHHCMSGIKQSMWLAGPGVVFGTFLMAVIAMYLMNWPFQTACIFGAIVASTDPVSVVALLKSAGASHHLTILIVGESLLNDGSAIVLYQLFVNIANGDTPTAAFVIQFFIENAMCSVLLGVGIGLFTNRLMRFIDDSSKKEDMSVQILITLGSAYLSFNLAQGFLRISGVLCASAAGLMLSRYAPPFMLHHPQMHAAWGTFEWVSNTMVFFFAGLAAADQTLSTPFPASYYYNAIILYLAVMVIRAAMLLLLYPALMSGKLIVTLRDLVFATWSGLRGALCIALALNLNNSQLLPSEESGQIFMFVVAIVSITLLVNATTSKLLLNYLGLTEESKSSAVERTKILELMKHRLRSRMRKMLHEHAESYNCSEYSIEEYCTLLRDTREERSSFVIKNDMRESLLAIGDDAGLSAPEDNKKDALRLSPYLLRFIRQQFYSSLRVFYHEYIMEGKIERQSYSAHALMNGLDQAEDFLDSDICDWDYIQEDVRISKTLLVCMKALDRVARQLCGYETMWYGWVIAGRERRHFYILTNFIEAHQRCQKLIPTFLGGKEDDDFWLPEEMKVKSESSELVERVKQLMQAKFNNDTVMKFNSQRAARVLLTEELCTVKEMVDCGAIGEHDGIALMRMIEKDELNLNRQQQSLNRAFVRSRPEYYSSTAGRLLSVADTLKPAPALRESIVDWSPNDEPRDSEASITMTGFNIRNSLRSSFGITSGNIRRLSNNPADNPSQNRLSTSSARQSLVSSNANHGVISGVSSITVQKSAASAKEDSDSTSSVINGIFSTSAIAYIENDAATGRSPPAIFSTGNPSRSAIGNRLGHTVTVSLAADTDGDVPSISGTTSAVDLSRLESLNAERSVFGVDKIHDVDDDDGDDGDVAIVPRESEMH